MLEYFLVSFWGVSAYFQVRLLLVSGRVVLPFSSTLFVDFCFCGGEKPGVFHVGNLKFWEPWVDRTENERLNKPKIIPTSVMVSNMFFFWEIFTPIFGEMIQFDYRNIISNGLKPPKVIQFEFHPLIFRGKLVTHFLQQKVFFDKGRSAVFQESPGG